MVRSVQVGLTVVLLAAAAGVIWLNTAGKVRGDSEAAGALLQYGEEPEEYGAVKAAASGRRGELLRGLEELIEDRTGINTMTAEDPMTCVAIGTGKYVEFLAGEGMED